MPEGNVDHHILRTLEEAAPFDEFKQFGLFEDVDDIEILDELEQEQKVNQ